MTVALYETHHVQTPSPASFDVTDAGGWTDQLASLRQGPSNQIVRLLGRAAGVGQKTAGLFYRPAVTAGFNERLISSAREQWCCW